MLYFVYDLLAVCTERPGDPCRSKEITLSPHVLTLTYYSGTVEGPAVLEVVELQRMRAGTDPRGVLGARLG